MDVDSEEPPSYRELSTISQAEWREAERSGVRSRLVGREEAIKHVARKATAGRKRQARTAQEAGPLQEDQEVIEIYRDPEATEEREQDHEQQFPETEESLTASGDREEVPLDTQPAGHRAEEVEEVEEVDLLTKGLPAGREEMEDTPMEDAPEIQEAPYLFRRARRYPPTS